MNHQITVDSLIKNIFKVKKSLLFGALFFAMNSLFAQSEKQRVLFTVESDTITASEFKAVYNKNRNLGEDIDPKTPQEYLDLYVNFKLKVHEAKVLGMDTMPNFKREYNSYRNQLAKPYLSDRDLTDDLIKEAYERSKFDVRASHIMIAASEQATPMDTLKAYTLIKNLKKRVENGESFEKLATDYSQDTYSAKQNGDLGYFTVFNMLYSFENAVYNSEIGELVGPIKTKFGYHLVKKTDQRPARLKVEVAHIMVVDNESSTEQQHQSAKDRINEIYSLLEGGAEFGVIAAQYSEDKTSAKKGGRLQEFGINKMYPSFEEAAFGIDSIGKYSEPIKTSVGYHIIQLLSREAPKTYKEAKGELKNRVERDSRSIQSKVSILKRLKLEYNFREYPKVLALAENRVAPDYIKGIYKYTKPTKVDSKILFEFENKKYSLGDFLTYLQDTQGRAYKYNTAKKEIELRYNEFSNQELINYEKEHLEEKYPDFALLSREYYEGILLFDLTEKLVWRKSVSDTIGLEAYYESHKADYIWDDRFVAIIIKSENKKAIKKGSKYLKKSWTKSAIELELNKESALNVTLDSGLFVIEDYPFLKAVDTTTNSVTKVNEKDGNYYALKMIEFMPSSIKTLEEAKGLVISDYQKVLEEKWLTELKSKYEVVINEATLTEIVQELEN